MFILLLTSLVNASSIVNGSSYTKISSLSNTKNGNFNLLLINLHPY